MNFIQKIISQVLILITLIAFVISTTGFTSIKHICLQHATETTLLIKDNSICCSNINVNISSAEDQCCETTSDCGSDTDQSACCTDEMSYHRLAEWYSPTNSEKLNQKIFSLVVLKTLVFDDKAIEDSKVVFSQENPFLPPIKIPLYRLFQQTKSDTHLL